MDKKYIKISKLYSSYTRYRVMASLFKIIVFFSIIFTALAHARLYYYKDSNGNIKAVDHPSKIPSDKKDAYKKLDRKISSLRSDELIIPFKKKGNSMIVQVTFGDNKITVPMIIDTGATHTTVTSKISDALSIDAEKSGKAMSISTANGKATGYEISVDRMKVANLVINNPKIIINDALKSDGMEGLLGMDVMGKYDVVIQTDRNILQLKRKNNGL